MALGGIAALITFLIGQAIGSGRLSGAGPAIGRLSQARAD